MWGFDITHAKDEDGNIIPVDFTTEGLMPGGLSNAKPFKCCTTLRSLSYVVAITVRSRKREMLLRKEWAEAQKTGVDFSSIRFDNI